MKITTKIYITIACLAVMGAAWVFALSSETVPQLQQRLIQEARALISNEIYVPAIPLLEEAAGYDGAYAVLAENELKQVFLKLSDGRGYKRKYINLLNKQMARIDAPPEVFEQAAEFYLSTGALQDALTVLKDGIARTQSPALTQLYEKERYDYRISRDAFENVAPIYNSTLQVMQDGKWGIASTDGKVLIPCIYDKVSTFNSERAIVLKDGVISAVDKSNNRLALASSNIKDFRNFTGSRIALETDEGWLRATGDFELGATTFEDFGAYSNGYAAAKTDGLWGVIDVNNKWLIPPQYDEIIQDEPGRCYAQGTVFMRKGSTIYLYSNGELLETEFEDARPFSDEGYAAVNRNGKWGFVDTACNIVIAPRFDDALSFGTHLAAVKINDLWGYISLDGSLVIDAVFTDAKSFETGCAPVQTEKGWQLLTLTEYKIERLL